jgi:hypothetical protein
VRARAREREGGRERERETIHARAHTSSRTHLVPACVRRRWGCRDVDMCHISCLHVGNSAAAAAAVVDR